MDRHAFFVTVVTFLIVDSPRTLALQNPYCAMSCNEHTGRPTLHTVCQRSKEKCGPSSNCGPDFREIEMTDELRQVALDAHNELRNRVASGNEIRAGGQPPAQKMMMMNYNKELEFVAQCWSNTCQGKPLKHDVCRGIRNFRQVGQNLGFINSSQPFKNVKQSIIDMATTWYDEVVIFDRNWIGDTRDRGPNVKVGHYTQMLWSETDAIGCALTYYTTKNVNAGKADPPYTIKNVIYIPLPPNDRWHHLILACNYAPAGNYIGEAIYPVGTPCSKCPRGLSCNPRYPGLCGNSTPVAQQRDNFVPFFKF